MSIYKEMHCSSSLRRGGYVYKRKRLQRNIVAILSEENASESANVNSMFHATVRSLDTRFLAKKGCFERTPVFRRACSTDLCKENYSTSVKNHIPMATQSSQIENACLASVPSSSSVSDAKEDAIELCLNKSSKELSGSNDRCSSSKTSIALAPTLTRNETEIECSSSDIFNAKHLQEISTKEFCISFLKNLGLIGKRSCWKGHSSEILCKNTLTSFEQCHICGLKENSAKMLICDDCDKGFHVSCCIPKIKKLPVDEWYCQPCFKKRPKSLLQPENRLPTSYTISSMLRENPPYKPGVRIGCDYQAEVPEWSDTVLDACDDYFSDPTLLAPAESTNLINALDVQKSLKANSIGNWVQCQEVIYSGPNDEIGIMCGKWRRAPLFVVQTDDWDCSCSLLWDPTRADCAVPQELETGEVIKHLKYVEMLRPRLAAKQQNVQPNIHR